MVPFDNQPLLSEPASSLQILKDFQNIILSCVVQSLMNRRPDVILRCARRILVAKDHGFEYAVFAFRAKMIMHQCACDGCSGATDRRPDLADVVFRAGRPVWMNEQRSLRCLRMIPKRIEILRSLSCSMRLVDKRCIRG